MIEIWRRWNLNWFQNIHHIFYTTIITVIYKINHTLKAERLCPHTSSGQYRRWIIQYSRHCNGIRKTATNTCGSLIFLMLYIHTFVLFKFDHLQKGLSCVLRLNFARLSKLTFARALMKTTYILLIDKVIRL